MTVVPISHPEAVEVAARALRSGQIVGIPTDTVYGLAVDPFNAAAAGRLFAAKRRPSDVGIAVLVAGEDQTGSLAPPLPPVASVLVERFWPGALTLVVPRRPDVAVHIGAVQATVGLRCPDHAGVLALCQAAGPLATTSANLHGQPTLTTAASVADTFGDSVAVLLDGGTCAGSPSTVVDCTGTQARLLREGRIPWAEVVLALGGGAEH